MKKLMFLIAAILVFVGCANILPKQRVVGTYSGISPWLGSFCGPSEFILLLNLDSTFVLNWKNVKYSGRWESIGSNKLCLRLMPINDLLHSVASGTLSNDDKEVMFVTNNKIKVDNRFTLKREKDK